MKDKIQDELSYILDDDVVGFFSITITKDKHLKRAVPTFTMINSEDVSEERAQAIRVKTEELSIEIAKAYS